MLNASGDPKKHTNYVNKNIDIVTNVGINNKQTTMLQQILLILMIVKMTIQN